jgi:hypothetical protein
VSSADGAGDREIDVREFWWSIICGALNGKRGYERGVERGLHCRIEIRETPRGDWRPKFGTGTLVDRLRDTLKGHRYNMWGTATGSAANERGVERAPHCRITGSGDLRGAIRSPCLLPARSWIECGIPSQRAHISYVGHNREARLRMSGPALARLTLVDPMDSFEPVSDGVRPYTWSAGYIRRTYR